MLAMQNKQAARVQSNCFAPGLLWFCTKALCGVAAFLQRHANGACNVIPYRLGTAGQVCGQRSLCYDGAIFLYNSCFDVGAA